MPKLPTIADLWVRYRVTVLPIDVSAIQVSECRRAFYAGAHALLVAVLEGVGDENVPTAFGIEYLDKCDKELQAFKLDVEKGIC